MELELHDVSAGVRPKLKQRLENYHKELKRLKKEFVSFDNSFVLWVKIVHSIVVRCSHTHTRSQKQSQVAIGGSSMRTELFGDDLSTSEDHVSTNDVINNNVLKPWMALQTHIPILTLSHPHRGLNYWTIVIVFSGHPIVWKKVIVSPKRLKRLVLTSWTTYKEIERLYQELEEEWVCVCTRFRLVIYYIDISTQPAGRWLGWSTLIVTSWLQ